jgi:hypothetical protein
MKIFWAFIGLAAGNFILAFIGLTNFDVAFERSFFQALALFAFAIVSY